ncbi:competence protein CoiA [Metabacillus sp. FJAT-53654]|uniref:Competence protein CoiA family protein n=1 Tax=Metabacillus rhizosphaerae TaxID=3117747 RepID=A0ABZ2MTT0_9BACI
MFVAYDEKGILVNVAEKKWTKHGLVKLRERNNFVCPTCSNEVELKIGTIITAHFAHKKLTGCTMKGEPETQYHMKGKVDLFEWLQKQSLLTDVQLEPYISTIKQRPDILFSNGDQVVPIEFQCSTIDSNLLIKRSLQYGKLDMKVLWILGAKLLKRTGTKSFQLSSFHWLFARSTNLRDPLSLYSYCPDLKSFIILHSIIPFSPRSVITNHSTYPIQSISYHSLVNQQPNKKTIMAAWIDKIRRFRQKALRFQSKDTRALNLFLYQAKQLPLTYLPSLAFLPLNSNYLIESPVYVWQGWILLYIEALSLNTTFTFQDVYHYIAEKVKEGIISIRNLLSVEVHYSFVIKEYLIQLCHFSILKQKQKNLFIKQSTIEWSRRIEELYRSDAKLRYKYD